ncbi:MAG TPA: tRNA (N(6)-L-threonylcarbamoyladenosine(37)-C(2))-methylthiotransferase MtaB, partial [Xanthobacteraceae bacterium]|nr:tRNA (N(6)-L-threonylcarbamoyladenosine(37)-C(2))-methylthiotransferase MtaB [Xanthobacteraceae bacterium]
MSLDIITFGCRLNAYESEVMRREAAAAGLSDTVIVNTCAVTAEAARQARQTIRRLARERPGARIVVTGCAAQTDPHEFAAMAEVDRVLGNAEKLTSAAWAATRVQFDQASTFGLEREEKVAVNDIMAVRETAAHLVEGFEGRTRAFVQVQNGCDHRCTFCIIPYGRGNSRSVPMGEVVAQIRRLTANGYREVVLTGVDITSYGSNLPGAPRLGRLVRQILRHVPELARLRLSSIDSVEADRDLLDAFAEEARLMPHLHLSLQAGDDLLLKRMKRRHLRADAVQFCETVRRLRPDIVFGGDIIAGFPTESDDMFARSLDLVDDCGLAHLHVFPFSPRPGTPAARMPQVAR